MTLTTKVKITGQNLNKALTGDFTQLSPDEIQEALSLLRNRTESLLEHIKTSKPAANDTLYDELEDRYGGSFAQWVIDRIAD